MSEIDDLRKATEKGSRLDESSDGPSSFVDELVETINDVESGERPKTIAVRDQPIAAFLAALDDSDREMNEVGRALEDELGRETSDEYDRSEIARLVFRVGLQTAAPEKMDELSDAIGKHAQQNV